MNRAAQTLPAKAVNGAASTLEVFAKDRYRSPLRYPGGKQKAIEQIALVFPKSAREYREPMVGGGSVYLHAKTIGLAKRYWINDKFKELVSFWQTVQDKDTCARLVKDLESLRSSFSSAQEIKKYFLRARLQEPETEYEEALLFFFFNRVTFSGTTRAGGFSSSASMRRFTASSIERLVPMPCALEGTEITNLDFESVIKKPGKEVFIFLDPPYFTATKLYGHGGSLHSFDHEKLAHLLQKSSHKFLITYDDCDAIRKLYKWANIKNWSLQYGMNNCNLERESKIGAELFISNY
ncbi:MAG: DNA adenine methylase [Candidatus Obscuribacterales bacterium]|nr:DNA adenine methylase [Candidatus Obscuribacterales bacterium]